MPNFLYYITFTMVLLLFITTLTALICWRWIMKKVVKMAGKSILTDSYQENMIELIPGLRHMGIQNMQKIA